MELHPSLFDHVIVKRDRNGCVKGKRGCQKLGPSDFAGSTPLSGDFSQVQVTLCPGNVPGTSGTSLVQQKGERPSK
ncbi:hypothetical protein BGW38_005635 [Lunasporangiospora selenospora]|uniref:Uncharacterized protein n=1 Tax=Lunasporangiospora selenospora TaxID=979761 RepID=A0A9P6FNI3_9FUNG|nr:hypothetical protein BGW38_005635 [Lunasporangiospora selenospora]